MDRAGLSYIRAVPSQAPAICSDLRSLAGFISLHICSIGLNYLSARSMLCVLLYGNGEEVSPLAPFSSLLKYFQSPYELSKGDTAHRERSYPWYFCLYVHTLFVFFSL